ncbi:hypothetical protein QWY31_07435 [Cytophagales bacterium LB-30]|uniref:Uncharacterized protein n=1 Tax=Shiella aurantiaca TaxID=3058365 RepID=A0ABT8F4D1_9BACT|nr:hypothetical protein [Shiella aurantiaca]MDN4165328.1 hypothetical protein [Shiella aurantiaca]
MRNIPESFMIFREELQKVKQEKRLLQMKYEKQVQEMQEELSYLKEQIASQHTMIENAIEYANQLEQQLNQHR